MRILNSVFFLVIIGLCAQIVHSQPFPQQPLEGEAYRPGIDVQHYHFSLTLHEDTDRIDGNALVTVRFTSDTLTTMVLDLMAAGRSGTGMQVEEVREDEDLREFSHSGDKLEIRLENSPAVDEE